jgi:hypothetical protein
MSDVWEDLAGRVGSSAAWRHEKAQQYSNDKRNAHSAEALESLEENLRQLPDGDEHAAGYVELMERAIGLDESTGYTLLYKISELEREGIGRYGFSHYGADGDPVAFLKGLTEQIAELLEEAEAEASEEEAEERYREACEAADEEAKEAADEGAKEVAEEAAKEAAEEAYKETYKEAYKEAYQEAYRETLIRALEEKP